MKWEWDSEFSVQVSNHPMSSSANCTIVDLCERIIDLKIPEIDPALLISVEVEQIESAIAEEISRSTRKIKDMQEKRASLLSLENKS